MGTEHVGRTGTLLGAVAAMTLALAGCSGGSGHPSAISLGPSAGALAGHGATGAAGGAANQASTPAALASSAGGSGGSGGSGGGSGGSGGGGNGGGAGGGYASTALPASAWMKPSAIPLDAQYQWPAPSAVDKKASAPLLAGVQDCQLQLSGSDKSELAAFPAAQADLTPTSGGSGGQDDWNARATVLATGDSSSGDVQGIYMLYTDLVNQIGKCANTAPGAKVTGVSQSSAGYAATITIPTSTGSTLTVHEYLAAPYGYLVELSVWVAPFAGDKPSAAWDGASSGAVLAALSSGPCSVTKLC